MKKKTKIVDARQTRMFNQTKAYSDIVRHDIRTNRDLVTNALRLLPEVLRQAGLPLMEFRPAESVVDFLEGRYERDESVPNCYFHAVHDGKGYLYVIYENSCDQINGMLSAHYNFVILRINEDGNTEEWNGKEWGPSVGPVRFEVR